MSWLRTADEKPIPARGWLALALYALACAFILRFCMYSRPAGGSPHDHEVEIPAGRQHRTYCGTHQGQPLSPRYAQAGAAAVVSCYNAGGQVVKQERLSCAEGTGHARLAGFGTDAGLGPYFAVDCTR